MTVCYEAIASLRLRLASSSKMPLASVSSADPSFGVEITERDRTERSPRALSDELYGLAGVTAEVPRDPAPRVDRDPTPARGAALVPPPTSESGVAAGSGYFGSVAVSPVAGAELVAGSPVPPAGLSCWPEAREKDATSVMRETSDVFLFMTKSFFNGCDVHLFTAYHGESAG